MPYADTARRGFTLIELLVVIAIIGILSSVVLASLNAARGRANDVRRAQDLRQIQRAIELYADENGHYPNSGATYAAFDAPNYRGNPIISPNAANIAEALAPYIGKIGDPGPVTADAGYLYRGGGNDYCVLIYKTPQDMRNFSAGMVPARCTGVTGSQCNSGINAIYVGVGAHAAGC